MNSAQMPTAVMQMAGRMHTLLTAAHTLATSLANWELVVLKNTNFLVWMNLPLRLFKQR